MAGKVHIVMRLLLLSFIMTGLNAEEGLILAEQAYDSTSPCKEDLVCFPVWQLSTRQTSDYIAIVSNGGIQTSEDEDSKCTLQIKDLTAEDVERHHCQQRPDVFSPHNTIPELILMPGKTVSLRCILFTYIEEWQCFTLHRKVRLTWVDEAGTEIQEDSQHQIKRESSCDITLAVTLQSPGNKKLRCQATLDEQVRTTVELGVRVPGRGRGLVIDLDPENQGDYQNTIGAAVGVLGCVVLTVLVALFVVNRRRTRSQLLDESCYTISNNNVMNGDDVIYADIIVPVGPDRVEQDDECESTVYACVRHK